MWFTFKDASVSPVCLLPFENERNPLPSIYCFSYITFILIKRKPIVSRIAELDWRMFNEKWLYLVVTLNLR